MEDINRIEPNNIIVGNILQNAFCKIIPRVFSKQLIQTKAKIFWVGKGRRRRSLHLL